MAMSYFSKGKKSLADYVYANVMIWQCSACSCWSREEFIYVTEPTCPVCKAKMHRESKNIRIE
jgi:uncharacterized paraquat-inducible protein A